MALFQKNPYNTGENKPLYTLGLNRTVLIVGLGNPGKKYTKTRHNVGFMVTEALAKAQDIETWVDKKDLKCRLASGNVGDTRVLLCLPSTYMNNSGEAVRAVLQFYKLANSDVVVVHDELDIVFGQIRCRVGGSAAGHNGVESIIEQLGEDFGRVRVGIGPKTPVQIDSADFVLATFSQEETTQIPNLNREATAVLTEFIATSQLPHDTRSFLV